MMLGIMQPYFFPYLGYFDLINRADRWVVFDTVQYIRHGWVNRNRILHPTAGWQYISVPLVKHARETPISRIEAVDSAEWRERILGQLSHYRKRAPYFRETTELVAECLEGHERNLARINTRILALVCRHLDVRFDATSFAEMALPIGPVDGPGDWALRICEAMGATAYINPPGGAALFDPARFAASGISLIIQEPFEYVYSCPGHVFEPGLSVIDALMWNSTTEIKSYLDGRRA
jgi:hypothetical protein